MPLPFRATRPVAITPSDSTVYDPPLQAIYVGVAGDLTIETTNNLNTGDGPQTFVARANGDVPVASIRRVMATGTAATDLIGYRK